MAGDYGAPIGYPALRRGTPVFSSDGVQVGLAEHVLADEGADIFDGIVVDTQAGDRFADAQQVEAIYERAVILSMTAEQARDLPEPQPAPAVVELDPGERVDVERGVGGTGLLDRARHTARRLQWRLTGRYQPKSRD